MGTKTCDVSTTRRSKATHTWIENSPFYYNGAYVCNDKVGVVMNSTLYCSDCGSFTGTGVGYSGPLYSAIASSNQACGYSNVVQGHLLNDNIGGKGKYYNLFPLSKAANSEHLHSMESAVKKFIVNNKNNNNYAVNYNVSVSYNSSNDGVHGFGCDIGTSKFCASVNAFDCSTKSPVNINATSDAIASIFNTSRLRGGDQNRMTFDGTEWQ